MKSEIWAIGGGKGGTGKSFITSNMGMNLARSGNRVTLIDADLGGANLHSFLKVKKPKYSLTDFFENKVPLSDIIKDTAVPNLRFVTGDIRSLDPTGIKHAQKLKLYRHIKNISANYTLIDLGAGSDHNVIDSFLLADKMVMVTLPEITAIENMYHLIKKMLFRKLNYVLGKHGLRDTVKDAWQNRQPNKIKSIMGLVNYIMGVSPQAKAAVEKCLREFQVFIVLNQVKKPEDIETGASIRSVVKKHFGVDARYPGIVKYNQFFWKYVEELAAFRQEPLSTTTAIEVGEIVNNIIENKQMKLPDLAHD